MTNTLDDRVLEHLQKRDGSTAWAMTGALKAERADISKACQRLKRKGLVKTSKPKSPYWQAVKP